MGFILNYRAFATVWLATLPPSCVDCSLETGEKAHVLVRHWYPISPKIGRRLKFSVKQQHFRFRDTSCSGFRVFRFGQTGWQASGRQLANFRDVYLPTSRNIPVLYFLTVSVIGMGDISCAASGFWQLLAIAFSFELNISFTFEL